MKLPVRPLRSQPHALPAQPIPLLRAAGFSTSNRKTPYSTSLRSILFLSYERGYWDAGEVAEKAVRHIEKLHSILQKKRRIFCPVDNGENDCDDKECDHKDDLWYHLRDAHTELVNWIIDHD